MNGPLAADKTVTNLDEDDKELVELLRELKSDQKEEDSQKADNNSSQTSRNLPSAFSSTADGQDIEVSTPEISTRSIADRIKDLVPNIGQN